MMGDLLTYEFMRNALLAGLLASLAAGIIGTFVVANRLVFLSGGIAHTAYGGIGLAIFLGFSPLLGSLGFSVAAALVIGLVSLKAKDRTDTIVGVVWAVGMAVGVILVDLTPGYHGDLMSYLFGSILTVPASDLWTMAGFDALIVGLVGFLYHPLVALSYDQEYAKIRGIPVGTLYCLLLALVAFAVVLMVRVVGLILVIALLTIAPHIAEGWTRSVLHMIAMSILLNALFTVVGLVIAYELDLTSGASIILVAGCGYFISAGIALTRRA